jgi:periplasmic copper chaperone A
MNRFAIAASCGLLSCLLAGSAFAADCLPTLRDGWLRVPPGGMQMMLAGFGRIENRCTAAATIVGAHSAAFAGASVHRTSLVDGISRMREVPELRVAAHGAAVFEPGALHLMLMQPGKPLKPGDHVAIEFRLQDGRHFRGEFVVKPIGG